MRVSKRNFVKLARLDDSQIHFGADTSFTQQELASVRPLLTPVWVLSFSFHAMRRYCLCVRAPLTSSYVEVYAAYGPQPPWRLCPNTYWYRLPSRSSLGKQAGFTLEETVLREVYSLPSISFLSSEAL